MEIHQHDGVVVQVAGIPVGLCQALAGGRGVTGGRGRRQGLGLLLPSLPPLYIGPRERGGAQPWPFLQGRVRPGRSPSSPRHLGGAFPL